MLNGRTFFSPNCTRDVVEPPPRPEIGPKLPFTHGRPWEDFTQPTRWVEVYGWMGYIPLKPVLVTPFNILRVVPRIVQEDSAVGQWHLPTHTLDQWNLLIDQLYYLALEMIRIYKLRVVMPYTPRGWQFNKKFKTRGAALRIVRNARNWFFVWQGLFSFLLSSIELRVPVPRESGSMLPPTWPEFMEREGYAEWVPAFQALRRRGAQRAGIFIDQIFVEHLTATEGLRLSLLEMYREDGIPIWYEWTDKLAEKEYLADVSSIQWCLPPKALFKPALQGIFHIAPNDHNITTFPPWSPSTSIGTPPTSWTPHQPVLTPSEDAEVDGSEVGASGSLPEVWTTKRIFSEEACAQRRAYMEDQLAILREKDTRLQAQETPAAQQARLNRERKPPIQRVPVYLWDIDENDPTKLVCSAVRASEREDTLCNLTGSQSVYFSSLNVWHCSWVLDAGPGGYDESDDEYEGCPVEEGEIIEKAPPPPTTTTLYTDDADGRGAPVQFQVAQQLNSETAASACTPERALKHIRHNFGYLPPIPYPVLSEIPAIPEERAQRVSFARSIGWALGQVGVQEFLETVEARMLYQFYMQLAKLTPGHPGSFANLVNCDLSPACHSPLATNSNVALLRKMTMSDGSAVYFLNVPGDLRVAVASPMVALAMCRALPPSPPVNEIIDFLVESGAHFHTFQRASSLPPQPTPLPFAPAIPLKTRNYRFTRQDFERYVTLVEIMLQEPRLRAVTMRGGYIWRLFGREFTLPTIAQGPTTSAQLTATDSNGHDWRDDVLTPHEEALLIGTYRIETGRPDLPETFVSWWPPCELFDDIKSAENYGFWANFTEWGYYNRMRKVLDGERVPLSRQKWAHELRGLPQVRQCKRVLFDASADFLDTLPDLGS